MATVTLTRAHLRTQHSPSTTSPVASRACSVQELLAEAVKRGYSLQGEMFSAPDLAVLARDVCHLEVDLLQDATPRDVCMLVARGRFGCLMLAAFLALP